MTLPWWIVGRQTPLRLLLVVAAATFGAEMFVMFLLFSVLPLPTGFVGWLVDSTMLVVLLFPVLYLSMVRPMALCIIEREQAGAELRRAHEELEARIKERTAELEAANRELQGEIGVRTRVETELQQANDKLGGWVTQLERRNREIALLCSMANLFHACRTSEETYGIIATHVLDLFPGESGALYVFDSSSSGEAVAQWGDLAVGKLAFEPHECWAVRRGRVHFVEAGQPAMLCGHLVHLPDTAHLCVPITAQGQALGILTLAGPVVASDDAGPLSEERHGLTQAGQRIALTVAEQIGLAIANLKLRETLRLQAIRDPLTGLFNRRYMEESLERELSRAKRRGGTLGIIMADFDHFKRLNDTFGHAAGDAILRELGAFFQRHLRGEDLASRYGGEEFMLILPGASREATRERAEDLLAGVKRLSVLQGGQPLGAATLSLGVSVFPEHGETAGALLRVADDALYRAKQEGRDRVIVAD